MRLTLILAIVLLLLYYSVHFVVSPPLILGMFVVAGLEMSGYLPFTR